MTTAQNTSAALPDAPEPTWDVAYLYPDQGTWSEQEYLALNANRLVEFSHGFVDVLVMPTQSHQLIVGLLYRALSAFVDERQLGTILFAPMRVRLWPGKFREPDVMFMLAQGGDRMGEQFWEGADLVIEVVSDDVRRRDLHTKRREYARAAVGEYWIVDPRERRVTVLTLAGQSYAVHGEFTAGDQATSVLLNGFKIGVSKILEPTGTTSS